MEIQEAQNYPAYETAHEEARAFYKTIGKIFFPALDDWVYCTSERFEHLIFTHTRVERMRSEQLVRFSLLRLWVGLIKISTTFQEFEEINGDKCLSCWGIIAILEKRKIKVVIRKNPLNGVLHFWSIIPAWKMSKKRDKKLFKTIDHPSISE